MYSLWFVQWDSTRRDHPRNPGRVSGSGPVNTFQTYKTFEIDEASIPDPRQKLSLKPKRRRRG